MNENVRVTDFVNGPFVIVVTDPTKPDDLSYPMVIAPDGGFADKEAAQGYIDDFARRKEPYLGLHVAIAQLSSLSSFIKFCSWEE
jgi:hypothetical protein